MNVKKANNISWVSFLALVLSTLPAPLFLALLYRINWLDFVTMPLITTILIIAFLLSLISVFKKTENKIVSSIPLVITLGTSLFIGLIVIVSSMA